MLTALEIRDILTIEELALELGEGLNVLTGETGAGKSILLDALGLALGWRNRRAGLLRPGAARGEVTAIFEIPPDSPVRAILDEAGLPADDATVILRRAIGSDGRTTAWVNDRRTTTETLRALAAELVELHGQHDERGLVDPRGHRRLVDAFGGLDALVEGARDAWCRLEEARSMLDDARAAVAAAEAESEFLRHAVAEIEALAPEPGEDATLDSRRRMMQAGARVREDVERALAALSGDGAEGAMADAMRWLEGASERTEGMLDEPLQALSRAFAELGEATAGVQACLDALNFDPAELERIEERLFAIRGLARKHRVPPDELAAHGAALRARLDAAEAGAAGLERLERELDEAQSAYEKAASRLTAARVEAAARLDKAVAGELPPLKLERARFRTLVEAGPPGPEGADRVEFLFAANPGTEPGPIARVASGGEFSRFLLALKVCLARRSEHIAMIFDEIDRGVGGATADAVGRRLARLAEGAQVLVVTHSPQVAARADHHFRVEKLLDEAGARTRVRRLTDAEREAEIARMLSGDRITDAARAAARALIAN